MMDPDFKEMLFAEESEHSGELVVKVEHGMDPDLDFPFLIKSNSGLNGRGYAESDRGYVQDPLSLATERVLDRAKPVGFQTPENRSTKRSAVDVKAIQSRVFTRPAMQEKLPSDESQRCPGKRTLEPDDLSGICEVDGAQLLTPSGKKSKVESTAEVTGIANKIPAIGYEREEFDELVMKQFLTKNSRRKSMVLQTSDFICKFFSKLQDWAQCEVRTKKLSFFHLRLQTAVIAREMGRPGFRITGKWFRKIKEQWRDFIQPVAVNRGSSLLKYRTIEGRPGLHTVLLVKWYDQISSERSVGPGELERKAVGIASNLGREIRPDKTWVKNCISNFGLYCTIDGERRLFLKPSKGLLESRFEAAFESWYHQWPGTLDGFKTFDMDKKLEELMKNYLHAVLDKHLEISEWESNNRLARTEREIAAKICGDSKDMLDVVENWQARLCADCNARIAKLQTFDATLGQRYEHWNTDGVMPFEELENEAKRVAYELGIDDFAPTENWLKRFVVLNGLRYVVDGERVSFTHSELARMSEEELTGLLMDANSPEIRGVSTKTQKVRVAMPVKTSLGNVTSSLCKRRFGPTVRSEGFPVDKSSLKPAPPKVFACPRKQQAHETLSDEPVYPVQTIMSESNSLACLANFENALSAWYIGKSSRGELFPGDVEVKAYEIARRKDVVGFAPTKNWLASFVAIHGLHFKVNGERVRISKPHAGILKYQFEAAFEAWYVGLPETIVKAELDRYFEDAGIVCDVVKNAVRKFHAAAFDWYRNESSTRLVSFSEVTSMSSQIARKVSSSESKIDLTQLEGWYQVQAKKLLALDSEIAASYRTVRIILQPHQLKDMAEKASSKIGIKDFQASKRWMKRFVQRHGLSCRLTESFTYKFDPTSANADSFSNVFEAWYYEDKEDWGLIMRHKLTCLPEGEIGCQGVIDMIRNRILASLSSEELSQVLCELRGVEYLWIQRLPQSEEDN